MSVRNLTQFDILALWEDGSTMHPIDGGLAALARACAESWEEIADWPFGRRNLELLRLFKRNFGDSLNGWVPCPQCGERLEFAVQCDALSSVAASAGPVEVNGLRFAPPSSRALASVLQETDAGTCVRRLLELCAIDGRAVTGLTEDQIEAVSAGMEDADPLAYPTLGLACVACGHTWDETLDPMLFVRAEVDARARRLLRDVHHLARAYGWTEQTVFAMSDMRRDAYLEMLEA